MMGTDEYSEIVRLLNQWIELLSDPISYQRKNVAYIQEIRDRIVKDPEAVKSLLDGNMWGGVGSFLDSAISDPFSLGPSTTDRKERDEQWQALHRRCDEWQRSFNSVTVQLGHALISWCSTHGVLTDLQKRMIESHVQFAEAYNSRPFQQLERSNIDTLEWNMRFFNA